MFIIAYKFRIVFMEMDCDSLTERSENVIQHLDTPNCISAFLVHQTFWQIYFVINSGWMCVFSWVTEKWQNVVGFAVVPFARHVSSNQAIVHSIRSDTIFRIKLCTIWFASASTRCRGMPLSDRILMHAIVRFRCVER